MFRSFVSVVAVPILYTPSCVSARGSQQVAVEMMTFKQMNYVAFPCHLIISLFFLSIHRHHIYFKHLTQPLDSWTFTWWTAGDQEHDSNAGLYGRGAVIATPRHLPSPSTKVGSLISPTKTADRNCGQQKERGEEEQNRTSRNEMEHFQWFRFPALMFTHLGRRSIPTTGTLGMHVCLCRFFLLFVEIS